MLKNENERPKWLGSRATEGILLGFKGSHQYLVLFPDKSFTWRTNVVFKERLTNPDRPNEGNGTVETRGEGVEAPTASPLNILEQPAPVPKAADNSVDDEETTESDQGERDSHEDNLIHTGPCGPVQSRSSRAGRGQTS